jgi:molecular chaperone GrpE
MSTITDTVDPVVAPTPEEVNRESLARAVNNLEASEARVRRNAERVYDEARSKLVLELLPVLDNLDRTLDAARGHEATPLVEGVTMVRGQLEGVLLRYGVERIEAKGKKFDPAAHDAVSAMPVSDASRVGMVIEQLEPGYRFGSKLLRPARVAVGVAIPGA